MKATTSRIFRYAVLAALLSTAAFSQAPCRALVAEQCTALLGLAQYTVPPPEISDEVLSSIGFTYDMHPPSWDEMSPLRKWESAWVAAERGTPDGGSRMIQQAIGYFAPRYASAVQVIGVQPRRGVAWVFPLKFAPASATERAPEYVRNTLTLLAEYSAGIGGIYGVLMDGFGLSELEASACIEDAPGRERSAALELGLDRVPPEQRVSRLRAVIARVDVTYPHSARLHPEFNAFRPGSAEHAVLTDAERKPLLEHLKFEPKPSFAEEFWEAFTKMALHPR